MPLIYLDGVPQFSPTTMQMYGRLPEAYRAADAIAGAPPNDFPLLRYMALMGDQLDQVEVLVNRFQYTPPFAAGPDTGPGSTSDLANPQTADAAWLTWMAQLYGVVLTPSMTVAERRSAVSSAADGWQAGNRASIIKVAQAQLRGGKFVELVDHVGGDMWQMQIITRPSESPSPDTVIGAILAARCKPVGVMLTHLYYEASWATIEAALPTWADWQTAATSDPLLTPGSWGAVEETQPTVPGAAWSVVEAVFPTWLGWETSGDVALGTLTTALVSGTAYTSLAVTATASVVTSGDPIVVTSAGSHIQTFTASAGAAPGATSISVTSLVANFSYPIGAAVADGQGAGTWAQVEAA
jgi:hypothetical protein